MTSFNSTTSTVVSRGECHITVDQCCRKTEEKKIVFNKIALNLPTEVAAQEIVNNGLLINVHCKELVTHMRIWNGHTMVRKPVFRTICEKVLISVTYEEAMISRFTTEKEAMIILCTLTSSYRLLQMLTVRTHFLTVDLKDTELFKAPDLWAKFGMKDKPYKRLFLVLTDASSTKFEKKERSIAAKKKGLKVSGIVFTMMGLVPIGIPLLVAGRNTSTCATFHHTWHGIFNVSALDVTPIRLVD